MRLISWCSLMLLAAMALGAQTPAAPATPADLETYIKANYTKFEYQIPTRDGVKLFTSVYVPKDTSQQWPILFNRTPYSVSPYGVDQYKKSLGPNELFAKEGYIFVYQDVRGRYLSEGEFVNMRPQTDGKGVDESTDTYDTIDWLVKNIPNNNGKVGMYGISYPGFYTSAGVLSGHPALVAASPQAPIADWWVNDDFHHNGTLFLPHAFLFLASFGKPRPDPVKPDPNAKRFDEQTPDGYDFFLRMGPLANANEKYYKNEVAFWNEMMRHPDYDEFWQSRNLRPHLKNIRPAVLTVGGWFDAEDLFGALATYKSIEAQSPGADNRIIMGPWFHGGWERSDGDHLGHAPFNAKTSRWYREQVELPFFNQYLKGKGDAKLAEATMFETGTNQWRQFPEWPPKNMATKTLYFGANGQLDVTAPQQSKESFDEYISDPAKPVPYINYQAQGMTREYMTDDQRHAASRPDVLVYQSGVLDADVTLAGPLEASLFVSTSGTDSDWIVKLIDVYPNDYPNPDPNPTGFQMGGYQQLVRGEPFRGRYRNSLSKAEPFVPGKVSPVAFTMPDILHTFRKGHRIMVQVQSTWFPLVDRNPQTFVDIGTAKAVDFQKATERVYRFRGAASGLRVHILGTATPTLPVTKPE